MNILKNKNIVPIFVFLFFFCNSTITYANSNLSQVTVEHINPKKKKKRYKANGYKRCKMAKRRDRQVYRIMRKAKRQAK